MYRSYLKEYNWALKGVGPKKLTYKVEEWKVRGTGILFNGYRLNILVRILGTGQNMLLEWLLLEAWKQWCHTENEADVGTAWAEL